MDNKKKYTVLSLNEKLEIVRYAQSHKKLLIEVLQRFFHIDLRKQYQEGQSMILKTRGENHRDVGDW